MALLFDFKTFTSPWGKAIICRAKKIWKKPFDIKISFKNSLGPVVLGTSKELTNALESFTGARTEYGAQRSIPNNEEIITQAPDTTRSILQ